MDMQKMIRIGNQIEQFYADERYTDIDGAVWVGRGEAPNEVWIVESGSDEGYMTKAEMMKKMCNELTGDEQFRRDEAVRIEALYEYAVEWTVKGSDVPRPITPDRWVQRDSAERTIEFNERMFPDKMQDYTVRLVKRRKAGPVEDA